MNYNTEKVVNHLEYGQNSNRIGCWYQSTKHHALNKR